IPKTPWASYRKSGWAGVGDWLGTKRIANQHRQFRPFNEARAVVRSLNLTSESEWRRFSKSHKRPVDIPGDPSRKYSSRGWKGWADWLGTETKPKSKRTIG